ncbi:MAG: hypothetical protein LH617_03575, partial [Ramlibacter sp.]|nr:hypothetical protein [Ramlibacter sp.]
ARAWPTHQSHRSLHHASPLHCLRHLYPQRLAQDWPTPLLPPALAAYAAGGVIALEMAQQLTKAGRRWNCWP